MEFTELLQRLNDGKLAPPEGKNLWEETSDRISIHAKGIRPQFQNTRQRQRGGYGNRAPIPAGLGTVITPANFEPRFQKYFDNYILNRHPNEQLEHYEWRLSTFPLVAQEIYLNAKAQIAGSIFQTSQYTIAANDKADQQFLDSINFETQVKERYLEHIFTDPYGLFAVVEKHFTDYTTEEKNIPCVELVESRYILHYEPKASILFQAQEKYQGMLLYYYIDRQWCIKLVSPDKKKNFQVLTAMEHNFNELPVVENGKDFFKSFVTWADLIARNMSDDEVIAKNASYPHIQMVESVCNECQGGRVASYPCQSCESGFEEQPCRSCGGRGTISVNPGEIHVIKESEIIGGTLNGQAQDRIKFINPDIAINKFSFDRVKEFIDRGMRSMHLKFVIEAQSGAAKALDRDQFQFLVLSVSDHSFTITGLLLRYLFGYLHMGIADNPPYIVEKPTQFQIKTEVDIQDEMIKLKDQDLIVRRQKLNEYMEVVYSGNNMALKKWGVTKAWDILYAMSDSEINTAKIVNAISTNNIIRHIRLDQLFEQIELEKGKDWVLKASSNDITAELETRVEPFLVAEAVIIPSAITERLSL